MLLPRFAFFAVCILLAFLVLSPVRATSVRVSFDRDYYFQGEVGTLYITLQNDNSTSALAGQLGVWFDWLVPNSWITIAPSSVTITIGPSATYFTAISFGIPNNVTVGVHVFKIQFLEIPHNQMETLQIGSVSIHNANEIVPDWIAQPIISFPILALAAIIIPTIATIFTTSRPRRSLSYERLTRTPLLSEIDEAQGKLKIKFGRDNVSDVYLVEIRIVNTGNREIKPEDYIKPVTMSFGKGSRLLTAESVNPSPPDLDVQYTIRENALVLQPSVLLNAGDSLTFKMLITRPERPRVEARIVGVKAIRESTGGRTRSIILFIGGTLLFVFSIATLFPRFAPGSYAFHFITVAAGYTMMLAGASQVFLRILRRTRMEK